MANYMARIELREAAPEDYERLDAAMQRRGYLRAMPGDDGVAYELPSGTYYVTGTSANSEVALRAAVDAAEEAGKHAAVMITDWQSVRWSGLRSV